MNEASPPGASTVELAAIPAPARSRIAARLPHIASPVYRRLIVAAFVGSIGNWMKSSA
jgi:hypothetical protein